MVRIERHRDAAVRGEDAGGPSSRSSSTTSPGWRQPGQRRSSAGRGGRLHVALWSRLAGHSQPARLQADAVQGGATRAGDHRNPVQPDPRLQPGAWGQDGGRTHCEGQGRTTDLCLGWPRGPRALVDGTTAVDGRLPDAPHTVQGSRARDPGRARQRGAVRAPGRATVLPHVRAGKSSLAVGQPPLADLARCDAGGGRRRRLRSRLHPGRVAPPGS